ncbi:MAG: GNAT family N-acetyltransferase [Anaerolineae bacterium]|nr:GNAT family N-acetyltransferase [Anaerolineae bacterium]
MPKWRGEAAGYLLGAVIDLHPDLFEPVDAGFIADIFVDPAFRGRGLARELVTTANQWFRQRGVQQVELQVAARNPAGMRFWESVGGVPVMIRMRIDLGADERPGARGGSSPAARSKGRITMLRAFAQWLGPRWTAALIGLAVVALAGGVALQAAYPRAGWRPAAQVALVWLALAGLGVALLMRVSPARRGGCCSPSRRGWRWSPAGSSRPTWPCFSLAPGSVGWRRRNSRCAARRT